MKTSDFDYHLPEELIAQTPLSKRSDSRLMVVDRVGGDIRHSHFNQIGDYLRKGDVLVLNDTKVIPARLYGVKEDTLGAIEILLLNSYGTHLWEALAKPAKRVKIGSRVVFGDGRLVAECVETLDEGIRHFRLDYDGDLETILEDLGEMPLPPYIHEKLEDQSRYQTVYSKVTGSAASPTAGLHFTKELLTSLEEAGIEIHYVTLHVGLGTFRPVMVEDVKKHTMHSEFYSMDSKTADALNRAKAEGRRIVAVGTTSVRTLETILQHHPLFVSGSGFTEIFIYPGYTFKAIDALITNFHLPKSTLLMLVSAFASKQIIMNAYETAVKEKYRFFSFGDSMFIQ